MYSTGGGGGSSVSLRSFPALGFDPTPGDTGSVQALILRLATANETIMATLPRLEEAAKITDDSEWGGSAAEEFSDHGDDLPAAFGKGGEAMTAVSTALGTWLEQMAANQAQAEVLEAQAKQLKAQIAKEDECTPLDAKLRKVIADAQRLQARHLREANAAAAAIRAGKDGDPFKPENDTWYVQGIDGLAVAADGISLATATAAAGLAATGIGVGPAAALGIVSTASGAAGSVFALGQQVVKSGNAPGWPLVGIGLGTNLIPGGGTAAAFARSAGRVALKGGSKAALRAARKDIMDAATGGAVPGLINDAGKIRKHGLDGKASRDLTETGREVAKRNGTYDELPRDVAERKEALQRIGLEANQQKAYADLVANGTQIAEQAGVELTPKQRAELRLIQLGFNPTPDQVDKAVEDTVKDKAEGKG